MATFNNKNYKEMNDAEVWVQVVAGEEIDEFGVRRRRLVWQKLIKDLELGSMVYPKNERVVGFKVVDKQGIDIRGFMDRMTKK